MAYTKTYEVQEGITISTLQLVRMHSSGGRGTASISQRREQHTLAKDARDNLNVKIKKKHIIYQQ